MALCDRCKAEIKKRPTGTKPTGWFVCVKRGCDTAIHASQMIPAQFWHRDHATYPAKCHGLPMRYEADK